MSLQEESHHDKLRHVAASIIQRAWRRHMSKEVFRYFKELISCCYHKNPQTVLKTVNPREGNFLDDAAGVFIRFRLGGNSFPPHIYYKIFTYWPVTDVCAGSPKDYARLALKRAVDQQADDCPLTQEDQSGWYQRIENNSWRLFCNKAVCLTVPTEIDTRKKIDFHHNKLQRKKDIEKWKKTRKIEWLKQMYQKGRLQTHPGQRDVATLMENSVHGVIDAIKERGDDEILEWELDELLAWTNTLNFDDYIQEWKRLACSQSSEQSKASHSPRSNLRN